MAGVRIILSWDNKPEFDRVFKRLDANFTDLTPVWETVKEQFWIIESDQFQSGGAAGASGKWPPLAKSTEAAKIAKYGTFALLAGTLIATEALYKSMTRATSDTILEITKDSITIGTKLAYATIHQRGSGKVPQRKVIDFSDKQKNTMMKQIQKTMVGMLRKDKIPVNEDLTIL